MTVREIIEAALRALGELAGYESADSLQTSRGLIAFKNMVQALPAFGMGGVWTDVNVTANPYTANENERLIWVNQTEDLTVYIPSTITEPDGKVRPPTNGARVCIAHRGVNGLYIYIGSTAQWLVVADMDLDTVDPLGPDSNEALIAMLSVKLSQGSGLQPDQALVAEYERGKELIAAKFKRRVESVSDPFFSRLTGQGRAWL